ncbi:MAG TPA: serine hydrolase domain-containing protein, partial [Puia sp.]|nr:serine hydrolase domain-containing protein [Puia sp.]
MKKNFLVLSGLLLVEGAKAVFGQQDSIPPFVRDSLDSYVERAMNEWQIPGMAVCIVKNGKVVLMKGYGKKELGGTDKVDENTLFMIGSNTKAFTATALCLLDNEKVLSLDDKVTRWIPEFRLEN